MGVSSRRDGRLFAATTKMHSIYVKRECAREKNPSAQIDIFD